MQVSAAIATKPHEPLTLTSLELDEPQTGEVQVRMIASGVCHTDAIVRDQWYPTPLPAVLGHEGAGIVDALGPGVTDLRVGDPVLLSFNHCCRCNNCLGGQPTYCRWFFDRNFGGRRPDGSTAFTLNQEPVSSHFFGQSSFASYANVPRVSVVQVPESAPLKMLAPLGCGIQTGAGAVLNSLDIPAGASFSVFGVGAVGLSAVLGAKVAGATTIVAVDRNRDRLAVALELGATHTVHADSEDAVQRIAEITSGGTQYALDTTGVPTVFTAMTESLAVRGHGGVVGAAALKTYANIDIGSLLPIGVTVSMIVEGDSVPASFIPVLIDLYNAGLFPFDRLVRTYPFTQINQAFDDSANGQVIKPVVVY